MEAQTQKEQSPPLQGNLTFKTPFLIRLFTAGASRPATSPIPGNLLEMQSLGRTPDLLNDMLCGWWWGPAMFSQILQVIPIQAAVFENHCSREKTLYK